MSSRSSAFVGVDFRYRRTSTSTPSRSASARANLEVEQFGLWKIVTSDMPASLRPGARKAAEGPTGRDGGRISWGPRTRLLPGWPGGGEHPTTATRSHGARLQLELDRRPVVDPSRHGR